MPRVIEKDVVSYLHIATLVWRNHCVTSFWKLNIKWIFDNDLFIVQQPETSIHGVRTMDTFWTIKSLTNHLLSSFLSILLLCCPQLMGGRQTKQSDLFSVSQSWCKFDFNRQNDQREINSAASDWTTHTTTTTTHYLTEFNKGRDWLTRPTTKYT